MAQGTNRLLVPEEFLVAIERVTALRPRRVLIHILEHGSVNTDELNELYGYNHPPRAARDVRENGIPLKTSRIIGRNNRRIASYTLDIEQFQRGRDFRRAGRRGIPPQLKRILIEASGLRCELCGPRILL